MLSRNLVETESTVEG